MFRAISCSSSGGHIVLIQHLVSSLSASDSPGHRLRRNGSSFSTCAQDGHLLTVTIPDAVLIKWARYCSKHVHVEDCNKCIKICASSCLSAKVILRCTVSETSKFEMFFYITYRDSLFTGLRFRELLHLLMHNFLFFFIFLPKLLALNNEVW